jgi:hypothetical protein
MFTTVKYVKRNFASVKYILAKWRTLGEIVQAINGKRAPLSSVTISPAGYPVEKLDSPKGSFPAGESWYLFPGYAEKTIAFNDAMWACTSVVMFMLHHEDGHLSQMAFVGAGDHTLESSELLADQWAIARCSKEECLGMAVYLTMYNRLMSQQLQTSDIREVIRVNSVRIKVLEDFVYA